MENTKIKKNREEKIFPAIVVRVIDDHRIVINRGKVHGIKAGARFLVYELEEEEVKDPITGVSLGYLEIVKGTGKVTYVQDRMSTVESDSRGEPAEKRVIKRRSPFFFTGEQEEEEVILSQGDLISFKEPEIGDKAKPV